jgi:hypothetical protein
MALGEAIEVESGSYTPESLKLRRRLAEAMLQSGMDTSPVGHWTQGANRMVQALLGGMQVGELERKEKAQMAAGDQALMGLLGPSGGADPAAAPSAMPPQMAQPQGGFPAVSGGVSPYAGAIASIESAHEKNPYQALGPVVQSGDRAYGKYQVMGENIGPWTKEILGQQMTPEQFLASPEAQEKVFATKFGQYVQQTGNPQDAASMWFTGRPAAEGANRQARNPDGSPLGIKGSEYVSKFTAALGPQGAPSAAPAPAAAPAASVSPEQKRLIGRLLSNPATRPMGMALIQRAITADVTPKLTDDMREYQAAKAQGYPGTFVEYQKEIKSAGAQQTQINMGDTGLKRSLGEGLGKQIIEGRNAAQDAVSSLQSSVEARKLLDSKAGVITGFGADYKVGLGKVLQQAGINLADDAIANSEAFLASRAQEVGRIIKLFGSGTGLSNADREYAEKAAAGQITLNEESIRKILDINERASRAIIERHNANVTKLPQGTVDFDMRIEVPEFGAPTTLGMQPAAGVKIRRYNAATGKIE